MKKFLAMVLTGIMVLSCAVGLSACKGMDESTYEMYVKAYEALNSVDSVILKGGAEVSGVYGEETMSMVMDFTAEEIIKSATDIDMRMVMSIEATEETGMPEEMVMFYTGGNYYTEIMGQKIKIVMPVEDMVAQANMAAIEFPETAIKSESAKDVSGGKELSFTINGNEIKDVLSKSVSGMGDASTAEILLGMDIENVTIKTVIDKKGNFKTLELNFSTDIVQNEESISMSFLMTMEIVQIGGVTIDFPADLEDYMDISGFEL